MNSSLKLLTFSITSFAIGTSVQAATMAVDGAGNVPVVDGADISSLSGTVDIGGAVGHVWSNRPRQGQSFTTGSNPGGYSLDAYSVRVRVDQASTLSPNWNIEIGSFDSGTGNVTQIALETAAGVTIPNSIAPTFLSVVTWTLDAPVTLLPNAQYAITVHSIDGGGFISLSDDTNPYAGGSAITGGGANGALANPYVQSTGADRNFHLNLTAIPEPSAALLGLAGLALALRRRRQ